MDHLDHDNTGLKAWQAAEEFSSYLIKNSDTLLKGKSVIELGSGPGTSQYKLVLNLHL